jgi:hypothetical protein
MTREDINRAICCLTNIQDYDTHNRGQEPAVSDSIKTAIYVLTLVRDNNKVVSDIELNTTKSSLEVGSELMDKYNKAVANKETNCIDSSKVAQNEPDLGGYIKAYAQSIKTIEKLQNELANMSHSAQFKRVEITTEKLARAEEALKLTIEASKRHSRCCMGESNALNKIISIATNYFEKGDPR